jgi:hypothetical protein
MAERIWTVLAGAIAVADVKYSHTGVLIGSKDKFRADETAWAVLMQIVRADAMTLQKDGRPAALLYLESWLLCAQHQVFG